MTEPMEVWAIRAPDGHFTKVSFDRKPALYNHHKTLGYRCIRVLITPVERAP